MKKDKEEKHERPKNKKGKPHNWSYRPPRASSDPAWWDLTSSIDDMANDIQRVRMECGKRHGRI